MDKFRRTKNACYYSYLSMSSVFCIPSMLFVTFHDTFGISYTLLGTLVLINFTTQLFIDLIFTFFSKHFNVKLMVTIMPFLTSAGMFIYALVPWLIPNLAMLGLCVGTVVFSVSAGLSEVLLSPIIAAIPSDNPERDMSKLHSLYAWGVALMVTIATLFFKFVGTDKWMYLLMFLACLPIVTGILFATSAIPDLGSNDSVAEKIDRKNRFLPLFLCFACIFLGSAAENVMTNWISGFMESAVGISKSICDIIGLLVFAVLLGIVRTLYAKFGKNIIRMLFIGMIGAAVCYIVAGISPNKPLAVIACSLTGAFTAMLWPGTLIMMEENMPKLGVAAYALMAAGGDFGAGVAPQLMGVIADTISASEWARETAIRYSLETDQIGLKCGMVIAALFPIIGAVVVFIAGRLFKNQTKKMIELK